RAGNPLLHAEPVPRDAGHPHGPEDRATRLVGTVVATFFVAKRLEKVQEPLARVDLVAGELHVQGLALTPGSHHVTSDGAGATRHDHQRAYHAVQHGLVLVRTRKILERPTLRRRCVYSA